MSNIGGGESPKVRVRCLGPVQVELEGRILQPPPLEARFLATLALAGKRGTSRQEIEALLWPYKTTTRSSLFRTYLAKVRKRLGGPDSVVALGDFHHLAQDIAIDVTEFERLAEAAFDESESGPILAADLASKALSLWRDSPFHDGETALWFCASRREAGPLDGTGAELSRRFDDRAADLEERRNALIDLRNELSLRLGTADAGLANLRSAFDLAPYRHARAEVLLRALVISSRRGEATSVYKRHSSALHELGELPSPSIKHYGADLGAQGNTVSEQSTKLVSLDGNTLLVPRRAFIRRLLTSDEPVIAVTADPRWGKTSLASMLKESAAGTEVVDDADLCSPGELDALVAAAVRRSRWVVLIGRSSSTYVELGHSRGWHMQKLPPFELHEIREFLALRRHVLGPVGVHRLHYLSGGCPSLLDDFAVRLKRDLWGDHSEVSAVRVNAPVSVVDVPLIEKLIRSLTHAEMTPVERAHCLWQIALCAEELLDQEAAMEMREKAFDASVLADDAHLIATIALHPEGAGRSIVPSERVLSMLRQALRRVEQSSDRRAVRRLRAEILTRAIHNASVQDPEVAPLLPDLYGAGDNDHADSATELAVRRAKAYVAATTSATFGGIYALAPAELWDLAAQAERHRDYDTLVEALSLEARRALIHADGPTYRRALDHLAGAARDSGRSIDHWIHQVARATGEELFGNIIDADAALAEADRVAKLVQIVDSDIAAGAATLARWWRDAICERENSTSPAEPTWTSSYSVLVDALVKSFAGDLKLEAVDQLVRHTVSLPNVLLRGPAVAVCAQIVWNTGARDHASVMAESLDDGTAFTVAGAIPVACFGPSDRFRALMASLSGAPTDALMDRADSVCQRIGARRWRVALLRQQETL